MKFTLRLLSKSSSIIQKSWREASTLLIASEVTNQKGGETKKSLEYLLLERSSKSNFMPGGLCFPGGAFSVEDSSSHWNDFYHSVGVPLTSIKFLNSGASQPDLYGPEFKEQGECLPREISFRITAIRETFEECGILLCKPAEGVAATSLNDFQDNKEEVTKWQKKIKAEPQDFICLCDTLRCVPDLEALVEWSNWLTPAQYKLQKHRFDTMFYMTLLLPGMPRPNVYVDGTEVVSSVWLTPRNLLIGHASGKHTLLPPQAYEMLRLEKVERADQMNQLLQFRKEEGIRRWCPVLVGTKDNAQISLFPGDKLYPDNPDFHSYHKLQRLDYTVQELERITPKHRSVFPESGLPKLDISSSEGDRFSRAYSPS